MGSTLTQSDFFARQDRARRWTGWLLLYFFAAVLLIVVALNLAAIPFIAYFELDPFALHVPLTVAVLMIILCGCVYKMHQLSSGGGLALVEMVHAVPVQTNSTNPREQILRNVVEEMAIAAGIAPPSIFVMQRERGINAFAAGSSVKDAVVCVTQGCLDNLDRDELQGVIAHEFSHILNGDMSMNLRLVGILHGILLIGLMGLGLMRLLTLSDDDNGYGYRGYNSSDDDGKGWGLAIFLFLVGLALMIIGYVGLFFARLIQAAVTRQREYLADASAVQFTRNADGVAGALKKLGASSSRSRINDYYAEELAHMFFASSRGDAFDLSATHPSTSGRIRAIEPNWDGQFPRVDTSSTANGFGKASRGAVGGVSAMHVEAVVGSIGSIAAKRVRWASDLLSAVPQVILHAAHDAYSARTLIFALLLSDDADVRQKQLDVISQSINQDAVEETTKLTGPVAEYGMAGRRVLCDLAIPALRQLSAPQRQSFLAACRTLIEADGRVTIFEFMLHELVTAQLQPVAKPVVQYASLKPVLPEVQVILSALAASDGKTPQASAEAFRAGVSRLQMNDSIWQIQSVDLRAIRAAIERLARCSPGVKRRIVDACAYSVAADGLVEVEESELLRVVTSLLEVPLPPLLADHEPLRAAV